MDNAFLVRVSVSTWTGRKLDKSATRDAKARAGAEDKAGVKVYKSLIAAEALDKVVSIANAARIEHRKRTVPWAYDGPGAITAEGYPSYKAAMAGYEREFNIAVAHFYSVYEVEREKARGYLGNLFNEADYPTSGSLQQKFAFAVSAEPMPLADNFRVQGLAPEHVEEIKKDIIEGNVKAVENANLTAWQRVIERVEKLKIGLEGYKPANGKGDKVEGIFRDSLIDNIKELADMIPSINIANDADLTRMQRKLLALTAYSASDLRESDALRGEVVKQASAVLSDIGNAYRRAA
jgi:hypothetical protein